MCRRLGMSLCGREKCALKRKPYPPGVHGKSFRRGLSEFGQQLREKQKVKFLYGLRETQFKNYINRAVAQRAIPSGEAIIRNLEMRLDNVIYRLGLAPTRAGARQMVNHGHITVNGKRITIPSFQLHKGDVLAVREGSRKSPLFAKLTDPEEAGKGVKSTWIILDPSLMKAEVVGEPGYTGAESGIDYSTVFEFYSR